MTFAIYEPQEALPVKPVLLRLVMCNNCPTVIVVDQHGDEIGSAGIISFREDGMLQLWTGLKKEFGFMLDEHGSVKIE